MSDAGPAGPSEGFLEELRRGGAYFLFPSDFKTYFASCLEDGLKDLGIPVASNLGRKVPGQEDKALASAALVIGDVSEFEVCPQECNSVIGYVAAQPARSVVLCMSDAANSLGFPDSMLVFAAHGHARLKHSGRRIPWAFGLNHEVLGKVKAARTAEPRKPVFVRNFRPSFNQSVRQVLDLAFVRNLSKYFEIDASVDDAGRFNEGHYARLCGSLGCLAYGGEFADDVTRNSELREHGQPGRSIVGEEPVIVRWDSWRFWESLSAGCLTVALDFDEYGFQLPVLPRNGVHYVGIRLDRLGEALALLAGERSRLAQIALQGQRWAMEHYAPVPAARRFLRCVELERGAPIRA